MRTKIFELQETPKVENESPLSNRCTAIYRVPILPAYAIEYAILKVHEFSDENPKKDLILGKDFAIEGQYVKQENCSSISFLSKNVHPVLIIHYHGIRDYSFLFPAVQNSERAERLGKYYEEAEKAFDNAAWLSFNLMCGAIFEGLLCDYLDDEKAYFSDMIKTALKKEVITTSESEIFSSINDMRNLVHLGRIKQKFVTRADVMDSRKLLDDMIIRFSTIEKSD